MRFSQLFTIFAPFRPLPRQLLLRFFLWEMPKHLLRTLDASKEEIDPILDNRSLKNTFLLTFPILSPPSAPLPPTP